MCKPCDNSVQVAGATAKCGTLTTKWSDMYKLFPHACIGYYPGQWNGSCDGPRGEPCPECGFEWLKKDADTCMQCGMPIGAPQRNTCIGPDAGYAVRTCTPIGPEAGYAIHSIP